MTGKNAIKPRPSAIDELIDKAFTLNIPVFVKSHPVWAKIGLAEIEKYKQFPKGLEERLDGFIEAVRNDP